MRRVKKYLVMLSAVFFAIILNGCIFTVNLDLCMFGKAANTTLIDSYDDRASPWTDAGGDASVEATAQPEAVIGDSALTSMVPRSQIGSVIEELYSLESLKDVPPFEPPEDSSPEVVEPRITLPPFRPPIPDVAATNIADVIINVGSKEDVLRWPVTSDLMVDTEGDTIFLMYDKYDEWPGVDSRDAGAVVNANPWIIATMPDGKTYTATWEWFRPGQVSKPKSKVEGGHIKVDPFKNWKPEVGVMYGHFVSGLARGPNDRNVSERTKIVWKAWE